MGTKVNRTSQVAGDQKLIDGLTKLAGSLGTFGFGGQQLKPADVVQVLQGRIAKAQAADVARAALMAAAKAASDEIANSRALVKVVKQMLRALFSKDTATLAVFGLAPEKATTPKPATLVGAAAKAKATRQARGTVGPRKRLTIKAAVAPQGAPVTETVPATAVTPAVPATKP